MRKTTAVALPSILDTKENALNTSCPLNPTAPCIGKLTGSDSNGNVLVQVSGGKQQVARLVAGLDRQKLIEQGQYGREVLLVFEQGDPGRPIITHLMEETPLEHLVSFGISPDDMPEPMDVSFDGRRLMLEAHDEIILKCGKGSIAIRKDGKIIIKGANLLSRSSGPHRIRGASVSIN